MALLDPVGSGFNGFYPILGKKNEFIEPPLKEIGYLLALNGSHAVLKSNDFSVVNSLMIFKRQFFTHMVKKMYHPINQSRLIVLVQHIPIRRPVA